MKGKLMFNEHYNWEQLEYNGTILKRSKILTS